MEWIPPLRNSDFPYEMDPSWLNPFFKEFRSSWVGFVYKQAVVTASSSPQCWFRSSTVCPGLSGEGLEENECQPHPWVTVGRKLQQKDGASNAHRDFCEGLEGKEQQLKSWMCEV